MARGNGDREIWESGMTNQEELNEELDTCYGIITGIGVVGFVLSYAGLALWVGECLANRTLVMEKLLVLLFATYLFIRLAIRAADEAKALKQQIEQVDHDPVDLHTIDPSPAPRPGSTISVVPIHSRSCYRIVHLD